MPEIQIVQIVAFMRLANRMHDDAKGARARRWAHDLSLFGHFQEGCPRQSDLDWHDARRRKTWMTHGII